MTEQTANLVDIRAAASRDDTAFRNNAGFYCHDLLVEIVRLEKLVYVPGLWRCSKCSCETICANLHVPSGGFSANNDPQRCPNGCGPMWRVTERDAGNRLVDRLAALASRTADETAAVREDHGRCEAITTERWYSAPHRCPFPAISQEAGKWLCGTHANAANRQGKVDE